MLEQRTITDDHQSWLLRLLGYKFVVKYRLGKEKNVVDALSRRVEPPQLSTLAATSLVDWEGLWKEVGENEELSAIRQRLLSGETMAGYTLVRNSLLFKGRLGYQLSSKDLSAAREGGLLERNERRCSKEGSGMRHASAA